jgi:hypothetical protein
MDLERSITNMATRIVRCLITALVFTCLAWPSAARAQDHLAGKDMGKQDPRAHQNHNPQHAGTFFMAMDNIHHLEGVLEAPGVFRVYVYNIAAKPLSRDRMKLVSGKVLVGDAEDAPEIPLKLSGDGMTMEAALSKGMKLPVTLTLLMSFPGMKKSAKPELFTFPFSAYTKAESHESAPAHHSMEGM